MEVRALSRHASCGYEVHGITDTPGPRPLVLLFSGKSEDELAHLVRESGADGFLCKNLSPDNLLEGVQRRVEHARSPRHRVLVVDDSPSARFQTSRALDGLSVEVEAVPNGPAAVERCGLDPLPELILLDVRGPLLERRERLLAVRRDALEVFVALLEKNSQAFVH